MKDLKKLKEKYDGTVIYFDEKTHKIYDAKTDKRISPKEYEDILIAFLFTEPAHSKGILFVA